MTRVTTLLPFCLPAVHTDGLTTDRRCQCHISSLLDVQADQQSYCQHLPHAVSSLIINHRAPPTQMGPVRTPSDSTTSASRWLPSQGCHWHSRPIYSVGCPLFRDMTSRQHIIGSRRFVRV